MISHKLEDAYRRNRSVDLLTFLLKQLAVHGITENSELNADEKIKWVLGMTCSPGTRHEVSVYWRRHIQTLLTTCRRACWTGCSWLRRRRPGLDNGDLQYRTYNLLVWLQQVAPDSPQPNGSTRYNQEHQGKFEPGEPRICQCTTLPPRADREAR